MRDLPADELAVDIEGGFEPKFETVAKKAKLLTELRKAAKDADRIYLATDHDREGEAIAYDLYTNRKRTLDAAGQPTGALVAGRDTFTVQLDINLDRLVKAKKVPDPTPEQPAAKPAPGPPPASRPAASQPAPTSL